MCERKNHIYLYSLFKQLPKISHITCVRSHTIGFFLVLFGCINWQAGHGKRVGHILSCNEFRTAQNSHLTSNPLWQAGSSSPGRNYRKGGRASRTANEFDDLSSSLFWRTGTYRAPCRYQLHGRK